jgi:hypothetical protein
MADTTTNPSANLIGEALYLEFRKGVNTAQVIITPEAITSAGIYVPTSTWRRQISQWSPRKQWAMYAPDGEVVKGRSDNAKMSGSLGVGSIATNGIDYALESLLPITNTLNNLVSNDWILFEKPIVVEFSEEDLLNTQNNETPQALIRRILRVRKEFGFPEELLADEK